MCQVGTAVSFDYNYKFHSFYTFVDLFKYMAICLSLLGITKICIYGWLF